MPSLNEIRSAFLSYFGAHEHSVMPSAPLVPQSDPTLMFVNAGMVPFKNVFTGAETRPAPRAATSQKCVRAGGKHNDLDNVGYTSRHHTFFEMLGNFSFGDYFKDTAIELAWSLITKEWEVSKDRLTVTVYHTDDEAFDLWKKIAGLPDARIIRIPTKDNFWAMGDSGPCGPCSEIFYDHGDHIYGGPPGSSEEDGDRFVEIWNLVFMQYEQEANEIVAELPRKSIDTGMGIERIAAVMQGVHDNYDTDLFKTLIAASEAATSTKAEGDRKAPHRVIADHLRSTCFLIADGVSPSNEGRGYVLRRIMRRAMRYAHILGKVDVMHSLAPVLVQEMGTAYPELRRAEASIVETLRQEEERFGRLLGRGMPLLEEAISGLDQGGVLPGETAFKLYDTYGFPLDLTQDAVRAKGLTVDTEGFEAAMERQRQMGAREMDRIWPGGPGRRMVRPARPPRPHRLHRLRPGGGDRRSAGHPQGRRPGRRGRKPATPSRSCSTARRSTPKAAARPATRAWSSGAAARPRCSTPRSRPASCSPTCSRSPRGGWPRASAPA